MQKYFSAFRRMQLTHSGVVSKAYVQKCREARGIEIWSAVFYSEAPRCGAGHSPPVVLGVHSPVLDAISIRAAVVCVPLLPYASWR